MLPEQRQRIIAVLPRVAVSSVIGIAAIGLAMRLSGQAPLTEPGPPAVRQVAVAVPEDEPPVAAAARFLAAWEQGKYREMYAMLSTGAKKSITESQFTRFYQDTFNQGAIVEVTAAVDRLALGSTALQVEEKKQKPTGKQETPRKGGKTPEPAVQVAIPVQTSFATTQMGRFTERNTLPIVQEGNAWRVAWTPDALIKGLQLKGRVRLNIKDGDVLRGRILDRSGSPLVWSEQVFRVGVVPARIEDEAALLQAASELLGRPREEIKTAYAKFPKSWLIPLGEIPATRRAEVESRLAPIGGVVLDELTLRRYAAPELAGPVLGLVGQFGPMDERPMEGRGYRSGDWIGRTGIEQGADLNLAGLRGGSLSLIAPDGGWVRLLAQHPPRNGKDLTITLDRDLQTTAEGLLNTEGLTGGLVVLDIATREVLAAVSLPGYDPGAIASNLLDQRWRWGINDPSSAFQNRTAQPFAFNQIAEAFGASAAEGAKALGLGSPATALGLSPTPDALLRRGAGITASPLQVAGLMAALAGDGHLRTPLLMRDVRDGDGVVEKVYEAKDNGPLPLIPAQTAALKHALAQLTPRDPQTSMPSEDAFTSAGPDGPLLAAVPVQGPVWTAAYAPGDQPRYAVVAVAEQGVHAGALERAVWAVLDKLGR